jgi:hypothetical protein
MNLESLPQALLLAVICVLAAMGLWYLGISRGSLKLKQLAAMLGIFPIFAAGLVFLSEKVSAPNAFRGSLLFGSSVRRTGPATDQTQFLVDAPGKTHRIEIRPKVWGGAIPQQDVVLRYVVQSPAGDILARAEANARPDKNKLPRWTSIFAEFQPREQGMHTLVVEVPVAVGSVDILVQELK